MRSSVQFDNNSHFAILLQQEFEEKAIRRRSNIPIGYENEIFLNDGSGELKMDDYNGEDPEEVMRRDMRQKAVQELMQTERNYVVCLIHTSP
tara:strand:+ start:131 stop:406 length:276 start_codon:yes stop_codon:yes gene_type:complete